MDPEVHSALRSLAFRTERSMNEIVNEAVSQALAGRGERRAVSARPAPSGGGCAHDRVRKEAGASGGLVKVCVACGERGLA